MLDELSDRLRFTTSLTLTAPHAGSDAPTGLLGWGAALTASLDTSRLDATDIDATGAPSREQQTGEGIVVGKARGLLVDLRLDQDLGALLPHVVHGGSRGPGVDSAGDDLADRDLADRELVVRTLFGLRAHARGLQGAKAGASVDHVALAPVLRGAGVGPAWLRRILTLLAFARPSLPVVTLPFPEGASSDDAWAISAALDSVRTAFTAAGFSPATAAAGASHELAMARVEPWWTIARPGAGEPVAPVDVARSVVEQILQAAQGR
ncbi:hypothetical protein CLV28_1745 [Sediminihabitans luteus]|uniref:Uncharacterized protein n=2 Tax=Sediminihabitans luteus TaxID=1138585 RepID=A0A2M9CQY6_9CELL|nr:hypothetical protein CLV28_1745 [Sediminihabitans luteus]GII99104.1 hypothetical protein Slu03_14820 [Sediminihabitans luteus]